VADCCKQFNLSDVELDKPYIIKSIHVQGAMLRRLLDMGIISGTRITAIFTAPAKNPIAYLVRGTVVALRKEDSRNITVVKADDFVSANN